MDWDKELFPQDEKPLDRLVEGYSNTAIFRKMAFIGDSLSSGEFEVFDFDGNRILRDMYEYSWGQFLARKNGIFAYNFSRGGMTAKNYMEAFADNNNLWDKEKACQAYVIALGVNDVFNRNMPLGTLDDVCAEDYTKNAETFIGYYAAIISRYKEISPYAKFFFVTLPAPARDERNEEMNKLLYGLCEIFDNSYVIDLYKYAPPFNARSKTADASFRESFFLCGHMNPMGYMFFAKLVDSYIDYIIRHNPQDFKKVGFICSDVDYKSLKD